MKLFGTYPNAVKTILLLTVFILVSWFILSCKDYSDGGKDNVIKVELSEYKMDVEGGNDTKPGIAVFEVTNNGDEEHSFVIEGIDTIEKFESNVKPGETRSISAELKPSRYNIYCPIDNHKNKGMASVINVEEPEDAKPTPKPAG